LAIAEDPLDSVITLLDCAAEAVNYLHNLRPKFGMPNSDQTDTPAI